MKKSGGFVSLCYVVTIIYGAFCGKTVAYAKQPTTAEHQHEFATCAVPKPNQCDLDYIKSLAGRTKKIPPNLLAAVIRGINFALQNGSAREISRRDLFHAHILVNENAPWNIKNLNGISLLFHTQEQRVYAGFYEKRNILEGPDGTIQILPCSMGKDKRRRNHDESICTVDAKDLGMANPTEILFVSVNSCPKKELRKYKGNIRVINGNKILFRIFGPSK